MTGDLVALHAVGLTKTYGDAPALGPVDLDVAAGERVVLVGHNGSGKTTLLRIAAGVLDATAGTITVAGNDVGSMEARAFTSYLGDQPVFYDDLTVWEHLEYVARLHRHRGVGAARRRAAGDARADATALTTCRPRSAGGCGRRRRSRWPSCARSRCSSSTSRSSGSTSPAAKHCSSCSAESHADGATLVVATHELSTVDTAERLVALRDGEIIYDGPPGSADADELGGALSGCDGLPMVKVLRAVTVASHVRVRLRQRVRVRGG